MVPFPRIACLLQVLVAMPATLLLAGDSATPRVGIADSMATIFRSTAMSPTEPKAGAVRWGQPLQIHLARNEFEGAQIVIEAPSDRALRGVQIAFRPLVRDGDPASIWPKDDISLWQVEEVEVYDLWAPSKNLGSFPDPLRPLEKSLTVPVGRRQSVLARFFAGPKRAAGTYRGELAVLAEGMQETRLPVEVAVWNCALPVEQHFSLVIPIWGGQMEKMYPGSQTPERRRAYLDLLYDYRVAPFPLAGEEIQHAVERGVRDFNLLCFGIDGIEPEKAKRVAKEYAQWQEKGWNKLARAYVLLGDEAPRDRYPYLREQGRLMHEAAPEVARCFTVSPETIPDVGWSCRQMRGLADTLILAASPSTTDRLSREVRAAGLGLWWYYVAQHYYIPTDKAEARLVLWRHWKYHVPAQLHWGMTYWGDANVAGRDGKKWPEIPWDTKDCRSGDGYLVYPAPGGTAFWPSVRLEQLRDGIEDYELFCRLNELTNRLQQKGPPDASARVAENRRLLAIEDSLVKSYTEYDRRAPSYRAYRQRLAEAVVATQTMIEKDL